MNEIQPDPPRKWPSSTTILAIAALVAAIAKSVGALNGCSPD